jgi:site-specific recombinase XerD
VSDRNIEEAMSKTKKQHETKGFGDLDYLIAQWLPDRGPRSSKHTARAYRADLRQFLQVTGKPFDQIKPIDIANYRSHLVMGGKKRLAEATIERKIAAVCSFYRFLNRMEVTAINLDNLERAKKKIEIPFADIPTPAEVIAMINAAEPDLPLKLLVEFLYLTGCRISEALSVRWRDMLSTPMGGEVVVKGKGKKSRKVYLPIDVWNEIMESRGESPNDGFVFARFSYKREVAGTRSAYDAIIHLAKAAKVDKHITPHAFRHACITHGLDEGNSLADLRDLAGHSNISITSRYAHATGAQNVAERLQKRLKRMKK